ncbi:hypothetical protein HPP92_024635 [Vanilla planifolia]|uniref:NPH3 domain-containing protein n=1 Tax=Vanilla planifolia TaxID=51239 RepID=A0A835UCS9_VANPL|nr:hypothetical protein HPP92_024635 [Vanilla planifolia]
MTTIKEKQRIPGEVIGEALKAYTYKKLPGFGKGGLSEMCYDMESELLLEMIVGLLPSGKSAVSCNFLLRLLRAARFLHCNEAVQNDLIKKIGRRLDETMVSELMFPVLEGESTKHDVEIVLKIVRESVIIDREIGAELREMKEDLISDSRKIAVGKLVDGYLAEIAKDSNLPISKFIELANMVPGEARTVHDGLYHAIDLYLKEHPELSKSEKKKLCGVMDCRKISAEACAHVVQNERLPLRMVVQVLFFEQLRAASTAAACNACSGTIEIGSGSNGSSRSALTEEIPASRPTSADDLKSLKSVVMTGGDSHDKGIGKVKSIAMPKKILGKLLSSKGQRGSRGGDSDTTGSPELAKPVETKSTPPRNARHSVS